MLKESQKHKITPSYLKTLPMDPGIYIFWAKDESPIYVGKSSCLKDRVKSYFLKNLAPKTTQMVKEAIFLSTVRVTSELEALLLEAELINKLQPKFNSELKDDKHPLYIQITDEEFPRVLTARKMNASEKNRSFFGPFPSSSNVKHVLLMLRHIFPYSTHKPGKRSCLYSQIGLCNPCPSEITHTTSAQERLLLTKSYRKNIAHINSVLAGRLKSVHDSLHKHMTIMSKNENFESAKYLREQIRMLNYITQPVTPIHDFLKKPNLVDDIRHEEMASLETLLSKYIRLPKTLRRIECFDVAHISGSYQTASMVTFINATPDKGLYRHFRIRQKRKADDIASLKEVAGRRASHFSDWGVPDLILVDGGKAQVNVFSDKMKKFDIPIVGLAKRFETLIIPAGAGVFKEIRVAGAALHLLQKLRNEAHRFARRYHHKLIQKELIQKGR